MEQTNDRKFVCEYEFDGKRWSTEVFASTYEEAEMKLRAVGKGKVLGIAGGVVLCGPCPTCGREPEE